MKTELRAVMAYIAGVLISGDRAAFVFDYGVGGHRNFTGDLNDAHVSIYDHKQGCFVTGSGDGVHFSLYHYGHSHCIDLEIHDDRFTGFDYGSSSQFLGTVTKRTIVLFDQSENRHFNYSI